MPKFESSISPMPKRVSTNILNRGLLQINECLGDFSSSLLDLRDIDGLDQEFINVLQIAVSDYVCYLINEVLGLPGNSAKLDLFILNDLLKSHPLFSVHYSTMSNYGFEDLRTYFNELNQQLCLFVSDEGTYYNCDLMVSFEAFLKDPSIYKGLNSLLESSLSRVEYLLVSQGFDALDYFKIDSFCNSLLNFPYKNFSTKLLDNTIDLSSSNLKYNFYSTVNPVLLFKHIQAKLKFGINNSNKANIENSILDLLFSMSDSSLAEVGVYGLVDFVKVFKQYCGADDHELSGVDSSLLDDDYRYAFFELLKSDFYIAYFYEQGITFELFEHLDSSVFNGERTFCLSPGRITEESVLTLLKSRPDLIKSFMITRDFSKLLTAGPLLALSDFIVNYYASEFLKKVPGLEVFSLIESLSYHFSSRSVLILRSYVTYLEKVLQMNLSSSMVYFLKFIFKEYRPSKSNAKSLRRILVLFAQLDYSYDIDRLMSEIFTLNLKANPALSNLEANLPVLTEFLHRLEYLIVEKDLRKVSVMGSRDQVAKVIGRLVRIHNKMLINVHNLIHSSYQFVTNSASVPFNSEMFKVLIQSLLMPNSIETKSELVSEVADQILVKSSSFELLGLTNQASNYVAATYMPAPTCISIHEGLFRFCIVPFIVEPDISLLSLSKIDSFGSFKIVARSFVQFVYSEQLNTEVLLVNPVYGNSGFVNVSQIFMTWILKFVESFNLPVMVGCYDNSSQLDYFSSHFSDFYESLDLTHRNYYTGYQWSEFAPGNILKFPQKLGGSSFSVFNVQVDGYLFKPV